MEGRLTELNFNEILMYLGYRGQDITEDIKEEIKKCAGLITDAARPMLTYCRLPVTDGAFDGFPIGGNDIREILDGCREGVLLAITLGPDVERLMMRSTVTDMTDALIMDACASVAIENAADNFESDLREMLKDENLYLTSRYSPGYGDVPMETQTRLCEALHTDKRIGLNVTGSYIMVPRKSVTAIMGISDRPAKLRDKGCEACNMFMTCPYRKEGKVCK